MPLGAQTNQEAHLIWFDLSFHCPLGHVVVRRGESVQVNFLHNMLLLGLYALIRNQITFKQQLSQFQQSKQIMANICADLCADYIGDKTAGKWIQMTFEQPLEATLQYLLTWLGCMVRGRLATLADLSFSACRAFFLALINLEQTGKKNKSPNVTMADSK